MRGAVYEIESTLHGISSHHQRKSEVNSESGGGMYQLSPTARPSDIPRRASIASVLLLPENQGESLGHQCQTHTAQSDASGHGIIAQPRSHQGYGSLTESVVEPEPASESVDDPHDVVISSLL